VASGQNIRTSTNATVYVLVVAGPHEFWSIPSGLEPGVGCTARDTDGATKLDCTDVVIRSMMATMAQFVALAGKEHGLVVVSTLGADATIQASLVNAGLLTHPLTGEQVLAFVTYGRVALAHLRARSQLAVTVWSGWEWVTIEGRAQPLGPDNAVPGIDGRLVAAAAARGVHRRHR
jgi:hypothetical protein